MNKQNMSFSALVPKQNCAIQEAYKCARKVGRIDPKLVENAKWPGYSAMLCARMPLGLGRKVLNCKTERLDRKDLELGLNVDVSLLVKLSLSINVLLFPIRK